MSTTNTSLLGHLGRQRFSLDDDKTAGSASSQAGATAITSAVSRITSAVASGSVVLRDMLTNDAPSPLMWVLNDSANTIQIYPFGAQTINGSANPLAVVAGGFAFLSRVQANLDWRGQAYT